MVAFATTSAPAAAVPLHAIPIHVLPTAQPHAALIYSHADAFRVRAELRLLGDFVGTLPKHTAQNIYLSLPLALSYDEAFFGLSRGWFRAVADCPTDYHPSSGAAVAFEADRTTDAERQVEETTRYLVVEREKRTKKEARKRPREDDPLECALPVLDQPRLKRQRLSIFGRFAHCLRLAACFIAPRFVDAPQPALLPPPVLPPALPEEKDAGDGADQDLLYERMRQQAHRGVLVITATEARADEVGNSIQRTALLRKPKGVDEDRIRSRAAVFADLHDKGYFLSCGAKFGADFLAYAGDPQLFHAALAVVVVEADEAVTPLDVVAFGRIGNSTKKRAALAFIEDGVVQYVSMQWEETLP